MARKGSQPSYGLVKRRQTGETSAPSTPAPTLSRPYRRKPQPPSRLKFKVLLMSPTVYVKGDQCIYIHAEETHTKNKCANKIVRTEFQMNSQVSAALQ